MARKYRFNQLLPEQLGIIAPGVTLPIIEIRVPLDDGTKAIFRPPGGKPAFDDGDEIDLDIAGPPGKIKRALRQLDKDPRFTKRP